MNLNKISCQKYVSSNSLPFEFIPFFELSVKFAFASQIYHENTNTPLDGPYLVGFGVDIKRGVAGSGNSST